MNKFKIILIFSGILFSHLCLANTSNRFVPSFENGFSLIDYQKCHHLLLLCPKKNDTLILDQRCIKRTLELNKFCTQLSAIADTVQIDPNFITLQDYKGKIVIVKVVYPGDGNEIYYMLTPKGELINTQLDPRKLIPELKSKYTNFDFYIANNGEPGVHIYNGGRIFVKVPIRVNDTCRTCETLFKANIKYYLSAQSEVIKIKVELD